MKFTKEIIDKYTKMMGYREIDGENFELIIEQANFDSFNEVFNKYKINFNPIVSKPDKFTIHAKQKFMFSDIDYEILAAIKINVNSTMTVEFINTTQNSVGSTNDAKNPLVIFSIIFNWVVDLYNLIKNDVSIGMIYIKYVHQPDDSMRGIIKKRISLYDSLAIKFCRMFPEFEQDEKTEDSLNNDKVTIFILVRK